MQDIRADAGLAGGDGTGRIVVSPEFDKFTDRIKQVLLFAREEASHFNHNYIGTEHLLLGLVREKEGIAGQVLREAGVGVDLTRVRSAVEFTIGRGEHTEIGDTINLTPHAKKAIEHAIVEARQLDDEVIDTEHFLLGLVGESEGIALGILESLGADLGKVRKQVLAARRGERVDVGDMSLSPRAINALRLAAEEARVLGHSDVGTGDLLVGLVRDGEGRQQKGIAASILQRLGMNLQMIRQEVRQAESQGEPS